MQSRRVSAAGDHAAALADVDAALAADPEYLKASPPPRASPATSAAPPTPKRSSSPFAGLFPGTPPSPRRSIVSEATTRNAPVRSTWSAAGDTARWWTAKLCLVDFTASWCGPCRQIAPHFEERLALTHPSVHFLKVDVDEAQEIAAAENVRSMPTFKLARYGAKVEEFSGRIRANSRRS